MTVTPLPLPEPPESFTDEDFDHIQEAKDALEDVVVSGRLDFSAAIAVAQAHALISIAQSLETLSITVLDDEDDDDFGISVIKVGEFAEPTPEPLVAVTGSTIDYYREG